MTLSIELRDLSVSLRGRTIVSGITAKIPAGDLVALVGPNGAGKSTLLRTIAGLLAPSSGSVSFIEDGSPALAEPNERARRLAYLPQERILAWPMRARAIVALGRLPHAPLRPIETPADRTAIDQAMNAMDIAGLADRPVDELSGGERARVLIARALAQEPDILIADEPSAALDPRHQLDLFGCLRSHAKSGRIVIAALHDLTAAVRFAGTIVLMHRGRIAAVGAPRDVLTSAALRTVYGIEATTVDVAGLPVIVPTGRGEMSTS